MVAGVAGGLADRFDIDVTVVRVAFVVLACLWGLGVALYLAMWALVPIDRGAPDEPPSGPVADELPSGPPWLTYLLLTGALFIGLVFSSTWWGGPQWGGGVAVLWLLLLLAFVVVALRRPSRRLSVGRVLAGLALAVVSLVIVAGGAFLGAVAVTGVPLTGGVGRQVWQPDSVTQLQPVYRLAVGSLTVDLTHVDFGPGTHSVTASVAVGQLVVDVPRGVAVDVVAHSGIGTVTYGTSGPQAFAAVPPTTPSVFGAPPTRLVVTADVGIGQVELQRGGF